MDPEGGSALPEVGSSCVSLHYSEPSIIYDYAAAAGQFAQVNGVLAALVFAAFVFILERGSSFKETIPSTVILLPVTFGVAVLSAYQYSIISSYLACETVAVLAILAGPSFSFVILAIVASMATMFVEIQGESGKSAFVVTVALFSATAALTIGNVSITVQDARATFSLEASVPILLQHTLAGLSLGALVILLFHLLVTRRYVSRVPCLKSMKGSTVVPLIAIATAALLLASGVLFATVGVAPDWASEESVRTVGEHLLRWGWTAPVLTGVLAGCLGAVISWAYQQTPAHVDDR